MHTNVITIIKPRLYFVTWKIQLGSRVNTSDVLLSDWRKWLSSKRKFRSQITWAISLCSSKRVWLYSLRHSSCNSVWIIHLFVLSEEKFHNLQNSKIQFCLLLYFSQSHCNCTISNKFSCHIFTSTFIVWSEACRF